MEHLHWKYCEEVLVRVSRTFALNIRVLRGPLYQSVLLNYLVCRIIDTIEDSPALSSSLKVQSLRQFPEVIQDNHWGLSLDKWMHSLQSPLNGQPHDMELFQHTPRVVSCFKRLPLDYQRIGERIFFIMANGMADFISKNQTGRISLENLEELKKYCYYVAGVIGEGLCESFALAYGISKANQKILKENCVAFGLGLQMTNIAKDILKDHHRGYRFFPRSFLQEYGLSESQFLTTHNTEAMDLAYQKLLNEAYQHLLKGQEFTKAIHWYHPRLRIFCLRPLWMAFETLKTLRSTPKLLYSGKDVKINRRQVKRVLLSTLLMCPCRQWMDRYFHRHYSKWDISK